MPLVLLVETVGDVAGLVGRLWCSHFLVGLSFNGFLLRFIISRLRLWWFFFRIIRLNDAQPSLVVLSLFGRPQWYPTRVGESDG